MEVKQNEVLLEVLNLKKYYKLKKNFLKKEQSYVKSVDGVCLKIKENTILGLVGESGCGKSTIGKTILGLTNPSGGSVIYKDKTLFDVEQNVKLSKKEMVKLRKELQIIFQDPYSSLNPRKNVGQIVSEGIKKHNIVPKVQIEKEVEEIITLCGLDKSSVYKYPHEFSGGQRQRIGIARVLAMKPKFIICDEPTAALDVSIQSQILNLMLDIKDQFGLTYLFISHNFEVVKSFCDEIAVMYLGEIVEYGDSTKIYNDPKHPYTKALISSIPIKHPTEKKERIILNGFIPSSIDIPNGCRFHTRCPNVMEICKNKIPQKTILEDGRTIYCHLYNC